MTRFALALLGLLAAQPALALDRLVTVNGEAMVAIPPDSAIIRIGVASQGKTAREASESNAKNMTAVLAAIKDAGVAERDIRTSRLSLQPQLDPSKAGTSRLIGFQATNQVTVRVRATDQLPAIVDRAISAGANEMSGIEFIVSEQSKLLDEARREAIADAHRKAEIYAQAAGVKLGSAVAISDDSTPPPRPVQAMRAGAVPVAPGEQNLRVSVTVSYELH